MNEKQSSYRQIFKATSIFGGVQVFNIFISIIRTKIIALLLGPAGFGIAGLFNSAISFLSGITNFGLGASAIRNIAEAEASGNHQKVSNVVSIFHKLIWFTGLFGTITTIVFSKLISQVTFGSDAYTNEFIALSCVLLFMQLTSGQNVLMQGMRQLKMLAKANIFSAIGGLLTSVPLYYIYGVSGIVPAIIVSAFITLCIEWLIARKIKIKKVRMTLAETFSGGKDMLVMGVMLSLSGIITIAVSYIIRIYISNEGGLTDVGYYTAGFSIVTTYFGMIFTAMGTDYYPRLAAISTDTKKTNELVNEQSEIAILILAPILCVFLVFINIVIILLYSKEFLVITSMVQWASQGILFKAASWSIGFLFLAKGDSKLFFWNEVFANLYILILNVVGYKYFGLEGLGISYLLSFVIYFVQVYIVTKKRYNFVMRKELKFIFLIQFIIGVACFLSVFYLKGIGYYLVGILLIAMSSIYSIVQINKRMNILSFLKRKP